MTSCLASCLTEPILNSSHGILNGGRKWLESRNITIKFQSRGTAESFEWNGFPRKMRKSSKAEHFWAQFKIGTIDKVAEEEQLVASRWVGQQEAIISGSYYTRHLTLITLVEILHAPLKKFCGECC